MNENPLPSKGPARDTHHWRRWIAVAAVAVAVSATGVVLAVVVDRGGDAGAPATTSAAAPPTTSPPRATTTTTSTTTSVTRPPTTTTTPVRPSATATLRPFFAAAATLDGRLRDAAAAINGTGPPWTAVTEPVARSVRAADLAPVARAIPAGLPKHLLRSVILVYSDLASRRYAMEDFVRAMPIDPVAYPTNADLLLNLRNGHTAAVRFPADLAAARALAAVTPAGPVPPANSRQAAEVRVLTLYVRGLNGGCGSRGGEVVTELPPIVWTGDTTGTVAGVAFTAQTGADGTWQVQLIAC